jgi:hypothetical protein
MDPNKSMSHFLLSQKAKLFWPATLSIAAVWNELAFSVYNVRASTCNDSSQSCLVGHFAANPTII